MNNSLRGEKEEIDNVIEEIDKIIKRLEKLIANLPKKTEKTNLRIELYDINSGARLLDVDIKATPTTALKLSEAISALIEYITDKDKSHSRAWENSKLEAKADEGRQSFRESQ